MLPITAASLSSKKALIPVFLFQLPSEDLQGCIKQAVSHCQSECQDESLRKSESNSVRVYG